MLCKQLFALISISFLFSPFALAETTYQEVLQLVTHSNKYLTQKGKSNSGTY